MHILITGGAGFIGMRLARRLLDEGQLATARGAARITRLTVLDHVPAHGLPSLSAALQPALADFLVISFTTDWRFAPSRSREMVDALLKNGQDVCYAELGCDYGHDSFLMPDPTYHAVIRAYMGNIGT